MTKPVTEANKGKHMHRLNRESSDVHPDLIFFPICCDIKAVGNIEALLLVAGNYASYRATPPPPPFDHESRTDSPELPSRSVLLRFLASRMTTVSLLDVGT